MTPERKPLVLVVDDERHLVRVLAARLQREGFITLSAYDGGEALTLARQFPVDVMLLDVRMPGLDGFETLHAVRALCPDTSVILMSCYAQRDAVPTAVAFLEKPFDLDELVTAVRNALPSAVA